MRYEIRRQLMVHNNLNHGGVGLGVEVFRVGVVAAEGLEKFDQVVELVGGADWLLGGRWRRGRRLWLLVERLEGIDGGFGGGGAIGRYWYRLLGLGLLLG